MAKIFLCNVQYVVCVHACMYGVCVCLHEIIIYNKEWKTHLYVKKFLSPMHKLWVYMLE